MSDKSISELLAEFEEMNDRVNADSAGTLPHEVLQNMSAKEIEAWMKVKNKLHNVVNRLRG